MGRPSSRHTRQFSHCVASDPFFISAPVPDRQRWHCRCRKPAHGDDAATTQRANATNPSNHIRRGDQGQGLTLSEPFKECLLWLA